MYMLFIEHSHEDMNYHMLKIMSFINETYSESVLFHVAIVTSLIKLFFFEEFNIF